MRSHKLGDFLTIGGGLIAITILGCGLYTNGFVSGGRPWQLTANRINAAHVAAEPAVGDIKVFDLWTSVNKLRQQNKVGPLQLDATINTAAAAKCKDMVDKNYWSHKDPKGADPWHFLTEAGVQHKAAAENIAKDFTKPSTIYTAWANSTDDKSKMIDARYTRAGYAVCKTGPGFPGAKTPTLLIVQLLVG